MQLQPSPELAHAMRKVRARPWSALAEAVCRAGYAARGLLYVTTGVIALLAALELAPRARGTMEALEAWAAWPLGSVLLFLTGLGLYGFAAWRAFQSLFDADRRGTRPRALVQRLGQAISGVIHFGLAVSVFGLMDAMEDLGEIDDEATTRARIESLLAMPGGELAVSLAGLVILGFGVGNVAQAVLRDFCLRLSCSDGLGRKAELLGKWGYGARGVVFLVAGAFMVLAGVSARSGDAKGLGAALDWLEALPLGDVLLALTALGLVAFGLFAFVEARFRTLGLQRVIDG